MLREQYVLFSLDFTISNVDIIFWVKIYCI